MKQKVLLYLFLGASVFLLSFASIGLWHWYWESHYWNSKREAAKKEAVEPEGYGAGDLIEPPKPFKPSKPILKPKQHPRGEPFPAHWGPEPTVHAPGGTYLPAPFSGWGSPTLIKWIKDNQKQDAINVKKGYPIHWGPEPNIQTRDYRKLPEPFGHGSSTLFKWIKTNQERDAKNK